MNTPKNPDGEEPDPRNVEADGWYDPDDSPRRFFSSREACSYLPDQVSRLEYEFAPSIRPDAYANRLIHGWRRFGTSLFRPRCRACSACRSLRVDAERFRPDRSQRRARKLNEGAVALRIGSPGLSHEKLALYHRFHAFQTEARGWPSHDDVDPASYFGSFVLNPFATQEWCYSLDGRLVGVGYVDQLSVGLSAIYYFHDPDQRARSLGTWNVLCLIDRCRLLGLPHLYLGFYVRGCRSLEYKARFVPNQVLGHDGRWADFLG
ncbi:MAG: arginyltransferase [Isosphaeraceae bacterium]